MSPIRLLYGKTLRMMTAAIVVGVLLLAVVLRVCRDIKKHRRKIEDLLGKREPLSDECLRVEFGAGIEEWPEQLRALKDVAKALSVCHAQLRPEDDLSFLSTSHELSGDKLLEFEFFIKRHATTKDSLGNVRDVGGLIRLLAQLGY